MMKGLGLLKCQFCTFWNRLDGAAGSVAGFGECTRFPPQVVDIGPPEFPRCDSEMWCAEWIQNDDETPDDLPTGRIYHEISDAAVKVVEVYKGLKDEDEYGKLTLADLIDNLQLALKRGGMFDGRRKQKIPLDNQTR